MKKQDFIEKWNVGYEDLEQKAEFEAEMLKDLESLTTEPQVDKVTAEYKTQLVIPVQVKNQNYCDLDGKIIPTDFIIDKEHFFYGGYGYIVIDYATQSNAEAAEVRKVNFMCQRQVEDKSICDTQCEHCENYFFPIEKEKNIVNDEILVELKRKNIFLIPAEGHDYNYVEHCSCNPKNGGSGICNCTLVNWR